MAAKIDWRRINSAFFQNMKNGNNV